MTLIELLGVVVIITVLTLVVGNSVSKNMRRGNRETVVSDLSLMSSNISDAYYDLGPPCFDPSTELDEFKRYLTVLQNDYLTVTFDEDTLTPTANGFTIEIETPLDVYEQRYKVWFVTDESVMPYTMIASGGDNGKVEEGGYASQQYGDDIVMIVKAKN